MNLADTFRGTSAAEIIGDALGAASIILLPFAFAWARFILTGSL